MFMKIMMKRIVNAFHIIGQTSIHHDLVRN